jgi:hypothetical protein
LWAEVAAAPKKAEEKPRQPRSAVEQRDTAAVVASVPDDEPRRNPFAWESLHEREVFRAEVERRMAGQP